MWRSSAAWTVESRPVQYPWSVVYIVVPFTFPGIDTEFTGLTVSKETENRYVFMFVPL